MTSIPPINATLSGALSGPINDLRSRIETVSAEAITGRYSDLVGQLDGRIDQALLSQKAVDDISAERDQLNLRAARLDVTQASLTRVHETVGDLGVRLQTAISFNDQSAIEFAAVEATAALDEIFSALNTRYGQRFLFSGDATDTVPFGDADQLIEDVRTIANAATDVADFEAQLDTYFNDPAGGFQQSIYSGTADVSDPDAVTGIDPGLRPLISSLAVIAATPPSQAPTFTTPTGTLLGDTANDLNDSRARLTTLRADRGIQQQQIEQRLISLDTEETVATVAFNNLTVRDQFEAAAELRDLQTNIEAAFLLTNRLASLSLVNFLR